MKSHGVQKPWFSSSVLVDNFCLNGATQQRIDGDDLDGWTMLSEIATGIAFETRQMKAVMNSSSAKGATQLLSIIRNAIPSIRTAIGLSQILNGIEFAFGLEFPISFKWILEITKLFTFDLFALAEIGCMGSFTYHTKLALHTVVPVLVLVAMYFMYWVHKQRFQQKDSLQE